MEAVTASPPAPELDSPELYSNRELSWLQFNERVLELAEDESLPLLERVKFLAIYAANLDEFYMVRVAGLHDQVDAGIDARGPDGLSPGETIVKIAERARELRDALDRVARRQPVGAAGVDAGVDLVVQPRHPHHVELVEVGGVDREELHALEQRQRLVLR